jgi:ferredoxin-NADP reductase/ferredoxin
MPEITYKGKRYVSEKNETVLRTLLRNGVDIPYSCEEGYCYTCTMCAVKGTPTLESQKDMPPKERAANCFLACMCRPTGDLEVALPEEVLVRTIPFRILIRNSLTPRITRLRLYSLERPNYKPGQFFRIHNPDGVVRSYSIASLPQKSEPVELHILKINNGKVSPWLCDQVAVGATLEVSGPYGECYYRPGRPEQKMVMIGTGTGLAPLWGILRDALDQGHKGEIHLFHGSRLKEGLYYRDELRQLEKKYPNFHYYPCLSGDVTLDGFHSGRAEANAERLFPSLKGMRLFLCGHPGMVETMRNKAKLAGIPDSDVLADPFVLTP